MPTSALKGRIKRGREGLSWDAADHLPSQEGSFNTLGSQKQMLLKLLVIFKYLFLPPRFLLAKFCYQGHLCTLITFRFCL